MHRPGTAKPAVPLLLEFKRDSSFGQSWVGSQPIDQAINVLTIDRILSETPTRVQRGWLRCRNSHALFLNCCISACHESLMTLLDIPSACHAMVREDLSRKHSPPLASTAPGRQIAASGFLERPLVPKSAGCLRQLIPRSLVAPTLHLGDWTPASDYTHRNPPAEYCAQSSAIAADAESPIGD